MKKISLIICALLFTVLSFSAYSQVTPKVIGIQQIDSLINLKLDLSKIDAVGKNNSSEMKTRGVNPCDSDYDNLVSLFKNLKANYASCCNGETSNAAVARILISIYSIMDNPNCKWEATQWLVFAYYVNDYDNFIKKYNCCS
jgi:hypothetical protein